MVRGIDGVRKFLLLLAPVLFLIEPSFSKFECEQPTQPQARATCQTLMGPGGIVDKTFFCPRDSKEVETLFLALIHTCTAVYAAMYMLNKKSIINALIAAHKRGAAINLVVDSSSLSGPNGKIFELLRAGIRLWVYQVGKGAYPGAMHHKLSVFKGTPVGNVLAHGSLNFTEGAFGKNTEDVTFRNSPPLVAQCLAHIEHLKKEADPLVHGNCQRVQHKPAPQETELLTGAAAVMEIKKK